jgi:hypothetical protein
MKKLIIISAFFASVVAYGQGPKQYKTNFSGANKKVQILSGANQLTVEGHTGNEVIVEAESSNKDFPDEAEGLRIISAGAVDNTGVGANATIEDNVLKIKLPKSKYFGNFKIKIPKDLAISIKESGNAYGKWFIGGLDGEVEINTSYSTVNIKSVSGPLLARCGYGKISVVYDKLNQAKPNAISASGSVDITLPADAKANLRLENSYGDIFTDFDLAEILTEDIKGNEGKDDKWKKVAGIAEVDAERYANRPSAAAGPGPAPASAPKVTTISGSGHSYSYSTSSGGQNAMYWDGKEWKSMSSDDCNCKSTGYTINGGGVNLRVHSDHGNIYLRKKKTP